MRGYVDDRSRSGIKDYFTRVTKKEGILNLTILSPDKTVIWDMNDSNIGKKMQTGWVTEEKGKNKDDRFYFSLPVKYQERDIADMHFLTKIPVAKGASSIGNLTGKLKEILKGKNLIVSIISFVILALLGSILTKSATAGTTVVKESSVAGGSPELQSKVKTLKEEIERLEATKESVIEVVANKQKEQKNLEKEIESLATKKLTMPSQTEELEIAETKAPAKDERSEEDILFDKLLGGSTKKTAKKKEELELTQRIVAKRREEIDLSGKIETRRKELLKLEQDIKKLQDKK
jgi:hypothetical protein